MKSLRNILTFYLLSLLVGITSAQNDVISKHLTHNLLIEADSFLCNKDTIKAIQSLEVFIAKIKIIDMFFDEEKTCIPISEKICRSTIHGDICLEIAELSLALNNPSKCIEYINKVNKDYSPTFSGCLNGILMYKTKISISLSNYYLHIGQNDNAIKALVEYFIFKEAYSKNATEKLKTLLNEKFTKSEVTKEVNNSIENIELNKNGIPILNLFGQSVILYPGGNIEEAKDYCRTNSNLMRLIE